ncbi:MAG: carcinine hydrolase/isopenicillin-N N-acyltransferase family protein [Archangium sp.]|nr:carcinine hydrolase/isopenicillin-N N-acyltransferase family protein [Archangium sp.]
MCDTVVRVLTDRVLFAKNSDREADEPQVLEWQPRREGLGGNVRCTWLEIPQAARTHAVLLSRPVWMWGAEIGLNEHGVAIGNEAVFTRERVPPKGGLTGMDLLRLALERAASAEEAVEVIKALNAAHGQGGQCGYEDRGFRYFSTFLVADAKGAFVLETAGRDTAVEKVVGTRSISNGLTIGDFASAHSDVVKTSVSACRLRRARTTALGEGADSPREFAALLRDHGQTPWPAYEWHRGAMRAPCMHGGGLLAGSQTTASLVVELTGQGARAWATGTSAPCISTFKPLRVETPLDLGPVPSLTPDQSLWWTHERLHRAVMKDPARLAPLFLAERDTLEARAFAAGADAQALWNEGRAAVERWTSLVLAQPGPDTRPWAARRYWARRRAA